MPSCIGENIVVNRRIQTAWASGLLILVACTPAIPQVTSTSTVTTLPAIIDSTATPTLKLPTATTTFFAEQVKTRAPVSFGRPVVSHRTGKIFLVQADILLFGDTKTD